MCGICWEVYVVECRPPVLCEGMDDAYLLLKTDWANIIFSQDSPGTLL